MYFYREELEVYFGGEGVMQLWFKLIASLKK